LPVLVPSGGATSVAGETVNELRVVNTLGEVIESVANFQLTQVQWQLNGMGLLQFTIPTDELTWVDYGQAGPTNEIQYFRRGLLYWWGVIVDSELQGDGSTTQVTCYGLFWYLHKLFFGKANRVNWLKGYSLAAGFTRPVTQWTQEGTVASFPSPEAPLIGQSGNLLDGTNTVVQLSGAGNTNQAAGEDAYYRQRITFSTGPWTPQAPGLTLTGYYYLLNFTGPANKTAALGNQQSGLYLALFEIDGTTPIYIQDGNPKSGAAVSNAQITNATAIGSYVRLQAGLIPPNRPFVAEVRLYAPGGRIQWGGLSLTQQDGYYPETGGEDENILVQRIVQIAQNQAGPIFAQMDPSKVDLNILENCPNMNIRRTASYPYANHQNMLDALTDWTTEYQGMDMEILFTDPQHRTFTTWGTAAKGRKGVFQSATSSQPNGKGQGLALIFDPLLGSAQFSANAENGGNNVIEIGVDNSTSTDQGSANIEGGSIDHSLFGGKDIEIVESAPNDITVGQLGPLATQREKSINGVPLAPVIRTRADDPTFGPITVGSPGLKVGDTVLVFSDYGWTKIQGVVMRIVQIDLYADDTGEVVDFTLNLPDPWAGVPSPV
jgi:hypothetical protein